MGMIFLFLILILNYLSKIGKLINSIEQLLIDML